MEQNNKFSGCLLTFTAELLNVSFDPSISVYCELEIQDNPHEHYKSVGETESLALNSIVEWSEILDFIYKFQNIQQLKAKVIQNVGGEKYVIGTARFDAIRAIEPVYQFDLVNDSNEITGKLISKCRENSELKKTVYLQLSGRNLEDLDTFSKSDPFLKIFKHSQEKGAYIQTYQSKVIPDNLNPDWEPIILPYSHFCDCNPSARIKIECYDYDSETSSELIGKCEVLLRELIPDESFALTNPNKKENGYDKVTGNIVVNRFDIVEEGSFIDYLRQGMNLNLTIAIDFTSSNGLPVNQESLHYTENGRLNEYESAIKVLGTILSDYDSDKKYPVFGFGGEPNWLGNKVDHAFALNKNPENPYVYGFDAVLDLYRASLNEITLSGPTHFSDLIKTQISLAQSALANNYYILLILTDGDLHDYKETVDLIVEASHLPISILIVGIGHDNFLQLKALDGDKKALVSSHKEKCARDIVQFVPYRKFSADHTLLAQEALSEIPMQLMEYMKLQKHR